MQNAVAGEIGKAAPPIGVAVATFEGVAFSDWVYVITFIYIAAQIGYLFWKWYQEYKAKK